MDDSEWIEYVLKENGKGELIGKILLRRNLLRGKSRRGAGKYDDYIKKLGIEYIDENGDQVVYFKGEPLKPTKNEFLELIHE